MSSRNPLVWILVGIGAAGLIVCAGVAGVMVYVLARNARLAAELESIRDPRLAWAMFLAQGNPDVEAKVDEKAGTLTLRNKETGEVRIQTYPRGPQSGQEPGPALPSWIPAYPGATRELMCSTRRVSRDGPRNGASFILTTNDAASRVVGFYEEKAKALRMNVELQSLDHGGLALCATDERRLLAATPQSQTSGQTTVILVYEEKQ